jgi:hypothetical protein
MKRLLALFSVVIGSISPAWAAEREATTALLLVDRHGMLAIERIELTEGRDLELVSSTETGIIDVLLPVGAGRSGSVEALGAPRSIVLRAEKGALAARTSVAGGQAFDRPARPYSELRAETIYVCATGTDQRRRAFLVRNYADIEVLDAGPFLDMFAGKIPLGAHDYAVTTDTAPPPEGAFTAGECPLVFDHWLFVEATTSPGRTGLFALDLGAGSTIVARSFLPEGCAIEAGGIARYRGGQREDLRYATGGATGTLSGSVGRAQIASLRLGTARFENVEVDVMDSLPSFAGRAIDGILGLDVLRRAARLSISYAGKKLHIGGAALSKPDGVVPCRAIASHLFVAAEAGAGRWQWMVDTGAPETILDLQALAGAGLAPSAEAGAAGGLDGGTARLVRVSPCSARLGSHTWKDARPMAADLAVFAPLRSPGPSVGLLGNDLLSGLGTVEIDLAAGELRFRSRP